MVGLTMSNRGGVYSFVLVFICAIVTIDVLYVHQRASRRYLGLKNIGFSPPPIEEKKSGLTLQNPDTLQEKAKKKVQGKTAEKKTTNNQ